MAFQEVHASQFTSPTTPYTACRHADGFFATETHSLQCKKKDDDFQVTAGPLPPPQDAVCVGHDQSGTWQLFSFLEPSLDEQQELNNASETLSDAHRRITQSSMEASISSLSDVVDPPTVQDDDDAATIAWLVLQSREELAPVFTASLTFRPLSPLLTTPNDIQSEEERKVVAWVGSADDSKLRCFVVSINRHEQLVPVELKNDVFSFDSPVMIMDALTTQQRKHHYIAVGCQDGTVRIISFQYQRKGDSLSFAKLAAHTILVDGPIMALNLSQQDTTIHLVIGSMCGFVCHMKKSGSGSWEGPEMVAEGLWNASLDSEDPLLAVDMLSDDLVAFGTHSGQCCVWQLRKGEAAESYRLVWKVQLPYSIHGLSHVKGPSTGQPCLLVTTRYTFHVFQRDIPKYCAETARKRVEDLISERQLAIELLKIA